MITTITIHLEAGTPEEEKELGGKEQTITHCNVLDFGVVGNRLVPLGDGLIVPFTHRAVSPNNKIGLQYQLLALAERVATDLIERVETDGP